MSFTAKAKSIVIIGCSLVLLFGSTLVSNAAVLLSGLDFWQYEHLENEELRGGPVLQLNTRPLVIDPLQSDKNADPGIQLKGFRLEFSAGTLMPIVQKREGIWISRGNNLALSGELGYITDDFTIWLKPQLSYHENIGIDDYPEGTYLPVSRDNIRRYPQQEDAYMVARFHSAYMMLPFGNWYFFLGKDSQQFGAGKHDTLHLSNSFEPFPMARLGTVTPRDTFLGYFSFLTYVGEMEKERHIPRAKFAGFRLDWSSSKRVELGISRSWLAGGDGQNNSFSNVFWDLYSEFYKPTSGIERYDDFRNQQLVFDFRIKIPEWDSVVYGEYGREDHEHSYDGIVRRWYHTQANILGLKVVDLFVKNIFLILERAETVERYPFPEFMPWFKTEEDPAPAPGAWYNHHQYKNGWTYQGIGMGHHMGADSVDEFFAVGRETVNHAFMVYLDREIHGVLTNAEANQETKLEVGISGYWRWQQHWQFDYELQQQTFQNFGQISGNKLVSSNGLLGIQYLF